MAKLTDKPPSRAFRVGKDQLPETRPAPKLASAPAPAAAGSSGLGHGAGMGLGGSALDLIRRELKPVPISSLLGLSDKGKVERLDGHDVSIELPCAPGPISPRGVVFKCSQATLDFLRVNVLRSEDLRPFQRSGFVRFSAALGVHQIPLDIDNDAKDTSPGSFFIPDTQAFIVTEFRTFAGIANPGLPGAHVEIDPLSLVGQVAFYLVGDTGIHYLPETTVVQGETASGGELVNDNGDTSTPPFTDTARVSVQAVYKVFHSPFPGYPGIVGAKVRGYMIDQKTLDSVGLLPSCET